MRKFMVTGNVFYTIGIQINVAAEDDETAQALIIQELRKNNHPIDATKLTFNAVEFESIEEIN